MELLYLREIIWDPQFKLYKIDTYSWGSKGLYIYSVVLRPLNLVWLSLIFYKYLQIMNILTTFQKSEGNQEQHPVTTFMIKNYNEGHKNIFSKYIKY